MLHEEATPRQGMEPSEQDRVQHVSSVKNPLVKLARALMENRRRREKELKVVLEGHRLVLDAIGNGVPLQVVFLDDTKAFSGPLGEQLFEALEALRATPSSGQSSFTKHVICTSSVMQYISDVVTPQGVVAIAQMPQLGLSALQNASRVLVADAITDPGNLGTLLRSAAASGMDAVFCSKGSVDVWNPKVVRSGMGAHFQVPILSDMELGDIARHVVTELKLPIYVADGSGKTAYYDIDWVRGGALLIGSEAQGPSQEALDHASDTIRIPMLGGCTESLNAAMAATIIMFEIQRQQLMLSPPSN
ncbi:rRNA methyltransferase 3A, mitochondrial [Porphyridium purpureum]|uniref:rRNA methyltransferase 3A, mitochondrial n=1 Tax=Porphyridium purpureum TaxID=35688 RepID=A0A5J4YIE4_PORPP|nr:rRNA methyltransferase 3A, mitochondrial [Porphyridium purpureum]|eukprot:POR8990..scf251_18